MLKFLSLFLLQIEAISTEIIQEAWDITPTKIYAFVIVLLLFSNLVFVIGLIKLYMDKEKEKKDKDSLVRETVSLLTILESKFSNFDEVKEKIEKILLKNDSNKALLENLKFMIDFLYDKLK